MRSSIVFLSLVISLVIYMSYELNQFNETLTGLYMAPSRSVAGGVK